MKERVVHARGMLHRPSSAVARPGPSALGDRINRRGSAIPRTRAEVPDDWALNLPTSADESSWGGWFPLVLLFLEGDGRLKIEEEEEGTGDYGDDTPDDDRPGGGTPIGPITGPEPPVVDPAPGGPTGIPPSDDGGGGTNDGDDDGEDDEWPDDDGDGEDNCTECMNNAGDPCCDCEVECGECNDDCLTDLDRAPPRDPEDEGEGPEEGTPPEWG